MKPSEIADVFAEYMEESTTPKGTRIQSFFNQLTDSNKRTVANNIAKAYAAHQESEKEKSELRKKNKKEISALKKKAKALGLMVVEDK